MAPSRRTQTRHNRQSSLSVETSANANAGVDLPPVSALFLIEFDVKAGYTIAWRRAVPNLQLDGQVEYKSLPSGLHTVRQDLIYFVNAAHAGISAFANEPCEEDEARNARMVAVGVLVPLSYGRLGRAWRHAPGLKNLAARLAKDRHDTKVLQEYWDSHKANDDEPRNDASLWPETPTLERKPHSRKHSASDASALVPAPHKLSPFHPAWSLVLLLDKFGPLIFPIHRAALLRKRILISCHAPIHQACDFVYDISILSNIPSSVAERLPSPSPTSRLRPLFNIGVHDIPFLMDDYEASKRRQDGAADAEDEAGSGWIACTTDSILAMKDTLWDVLVTMPPESPSGSPNKTWPTVEHPRGTPVKATQRDLRRFNILRSGLLRLATPPVSSTAQESASSPPQPSPDRPPTSRSQRLVRDEQDEGVDSLVEPVTWTALAYNGYMWWASAGEQLRSDEQEEASRDAALLADLAPAPHTPVSVPRSASRELLSASPVSSAGARRGNPSDGAEARTELAIIAFFHRLTTQMLSVLADLVQNTDEAYLSRYRDDDDDDDDNDGDEDEADALLNDDSSSPEARAVVVDSHAVENMGLDVWSTADASFVQDLVETYFGRSARIESKGVEVCGVRVC